jgi:SAM-dependent methyltransferase
MNYRLAYAIGFHPWEDLAEHPPFADKLMELVAREEDGYGPPYGAALDIGTGSAVWGVRLAERGWDVTGIDIVEKALRRARERADEAGVELRLVYGDVTGQREADVASGFRLLFDTGTFHGLTDAQRGGTDPDAAASGRRRAFRDGHPRRLQGTKRRSESLPRARSANARGRGVSAVVQAPSVGAGETRYE